MLKKQFLYYLLKLSRKVTIDWQKFISIIFYRVKNKELKNIMQLNRKKLNTIENFLEKEIYNKNNYGIQERIYKKINNEIGNFLTYSDIISFLGIKSFAGKLNYLEIGTSVLKNFIQIKENFNSSNLIAYDINPINPTLENEFYKQVNNNKSTYFRGSVLIDKDTIEFHKLIDLKFNLVFSDALHEPQPVYTEFINIYKEYLDSKFLIYYDDLDFKDLFATVKKIKTELSKQINNLNFYTFKTFGWIGVNEPMHLNGIISNIDIEKILIENKVKLYGFKVVK